MAGEQVGVGGCPFTQGGDSFSAPVHARCLPSLISFKLIEFSQTPLEDDADDEDDSSGGSHFINKET